VDVGAKEDDMTGFQFQFCSVSKVYDGHSALSEVSFTVNAGEHKAILGPSGCGKSTALRLLAGLEAPSQGQVLLDGEAISEPNRVLMPPFLRGIAMVFQDLALWPNLTAMGNVLLGLSGAKLPRREARGRAEEALALCGIASLAHRRPGQLSGGQQQRVALARAIAARPRLLVLDEPFSSVDITTKARLLGEIRSLATQQNLTLVLVSHDPLEATALCEAAVILEDGRVQESGLLTDLIRDPHSQMLRTFRDYYRLQ
jgi:ABC-type Fe3+/spermidine/putrescine transport system ATPase subunit